MKNRLIAFLRDEDGLTTVEYAIAAALITVAAVGSFTTLGATVAAFITALADSLADAG